MNPAVLKKCVEELEKDTPRLDYVRGMLETLLLSIEPQEVARAVLVEHISALAPLKPIPTSIDSEAAILDNKARAAVDIIKNLGGEQV